MFYCFFVIRYILVKCFVYLLTSAIVSGSWIGGYRFERLTSAIVSGSWIGGYSSTS